MPFLFQKLEVYQRAVKLAGRMTLLTAEFSSGSGAISDQLRRAAISISCNIAEGNGRWHKKEKIRFFMIARGSAFECVPLLDVARRLGLIQEDAYQGSIVYCLLLSCSGEATAWERRRFPGLISNFLFGAG